MLTSMQAAGRNAVLSLAVLAFVLAGAPAYAVVKKSQLVTGVDGKPLAGQTVTITFPDGTTKEEETDKDGMVFWLADQDGIYTITPKGATPIQVNVTGAAGGGVNWMAAGLLAAGVVAAGVALSDDDDDGGSSGGGGADCTSAELDLGASITSVTVVFNPGNHPNLFPGSGCAINPNGSSVDVQCSGSDWNFAASGVSVMPGCEIDAVGTGVYSGFSNTQFRWHAAFNLGSDTWQGTIAAGTNGSLPGGQRIEANASGALTGPP